MRGCDVSLGSLQVKDYTVLNTVNVEAIAGELAHQILFFFHLPLLVTTRASPSGCTTGYLQRFLQFIPFTNLPLKYQVSIWAVPFGVFQEFSFVWILLEVL